MGLFVITAAAVAYGVAAGLMLPRAAYRLAVEPDEPWRDRCPEGHPIRGWLGLPYCRGRHAQAPAPRTPAGPDGAGPERAAAAGQSGRAAEPGSERAASHRYGGSVAWSGGLAGAVCGVVGGAVGGRPEGVVFVGVAPVLLLLALVDLAVQRLPDLLTLPLAGATAAGLGGAALLPGAGGDWSGALLGGAALAGAYLLLFLINPAGMGFGDVKLALALGVILGWYGWGVWAVGAFLGFLYGALYGLALVLRGPRGRRTAFPFGPFMAAGALTGVLLGGFGA
ncbi:A24 family peptidase [Streptomyces sp. KS 21]|uniref:prepilin peptidase n=1 Tax=Streptomyces sp. KS 21 TaxID=2485150 RepID=UPI001063F436|nr:A24 family peptidase [Streptomyces sp. KS 21]TDU76278.1 leader peptidase (prepilin peptidase)/N-methyltransferase [Streptomyces sp. KS 21]